MQCGLPYNFFASATQKDRPIDHKSASDFQNELGSDLADTWLPDLSKLLSRLSF